MKARVGILLSGRGSNCRALHDAMLRGELPAEIVLVASDVADAPGLAAARERGLAVAAFPRSAVPDREIHETGILEALAAAAAEWVCLAGYMRRLSPGFIARHRERILNIHPSLLPAFPGLEAQRQAVEHGVKVSGCTVHLVDDGLDRGPIVLQRAVPVADDDTPQSLGERILAEEHRAYPEALRLLLTRPWRVEGRRVVFGGEPVGA